MMTESQYRDYVKGWKYGRKLGPLAGQHFNRYFLEGYQDARQGIEYGRANLQSYKSQQSQKQQLISKIEAERGMSIPSLQQKSLTELQQEYSDIGGEKGKYYAILNSILKQKGGDYTLYELEGKLKEAKEKSQKEKEEQIRKESETGGVVSAFERPEGFFEGALFDISKTRGEFRTKQLRGEKIGIKGGVTLFGTGVASEVFSQGLFIKELATSPKETITGVPAGIKSQFEYVSGGGFSQQIMEEPIFTSGQIAGNLLLLKGTGKAVEFAGKGVELTRARTSLKYAPVETKVLPELKTTEQFISVKGIGGTEEIGLIPAGVEKKAQTLMPSVRGGFGFSKTEQTAFLKGKGAIVSSQAEFPEEFLTGEKALEKEFFATPPLAGRGYARVSRLGLEQQKAGFVDILSGDITFKKNKPQMIVFPEEIVGRKGGFQPQLQGTELETTFSGTLKKTGEPAVTIIKGKTGFRRVRITTAEILGNEGGIKVSFGEKNFKSPSYKIPEKDILDLSTLDTTRPYFSTRQLSLSSSLSFGKSSNKILSLGNVSKGLSMGGISKMKSPLSFGKSLGLSAPLSKTPSYKFSNPKLSSGISPNISYPNLPMPISSKNTPFLPPLELYEPKPPRRKGKRKLKRTPSLISLSLGIEAPSMNIGEVSGLVERPLLTTTKRRKRKRG